MGSTGAYNMLRRMTQTSISYKFQSIVPPPVPSRTDSRHNSTFSYYSESGGHVKWDDFPVKRIDDADEYAESDKESNDGKSVLHVVLEYIKILIPHVGLNILSLTYLMIGTFVFLYLEKDNELQTRREKFHQVQNIYRLIVNEAVSICRSEQYNSPTTVERRMRPLLSILSRTHEYDDRLTREMQMWSDNVEHLPTKWTFAASTLYALTVITCCGYDHVTPITDAGKIFTIFYGLIGIPLMFITAADIGKFLSGLVIKFYGKMRACLTWMASVADAMRDYVSSDVDSIDSRKFHKQRRLRRRRKADGLGMEDDDEDDEEARLPIVSYVVLVISYCVVGSLLFNAWERGAIWSFIHGVFFSYNTITTIVLGNIRVMNDFYLALTVSYIIIGLAVITASLDLCSSTIKRIFNKLHYFGRRIRGARRGLADVSDDIREAMKIMAALKKTRPGKDRITLEDLRRFLEVQEQLLRQPFVPYNIQIFRWIEDAYAQYFEDNGTGGTTAMMEQNNNIKDFKPMLSI